VRKACLYPSFASVALWASVRLLAAVGLLAAVALLPACTVLPSPETSAARWPPGSAAPRESAPQPPYPAVPAPGPLAPSRPAPFALGPASSALVAQAHAQTSAQDYALAAATIERALRIEPGNPLLWIELGRIRLRDSLRSFRSVFAVFCDHWNHPFDAGVSDTRILSSCASGKNQSQEQNFAIPRVFSNSPAAFPYLLVSAADESG